MSNVSNSNYFEARSSFDPEAMETLIARKDCHAGKLFGGVGGIDAASAVWIKVSSLHTDSQRTVKYCV